MTARVLIADHAAAAQAAGPDGGLDVIVVDLDGCREPASVVRAVSRRSGTAVLALASADDPREIQALLDAGASGYVVKDGAHTELIEAVRRAADGDGYLHPAVEARLRAHAGAGEQLTERERHVLRLLVFGHTNREIATALSVSVRTVELTRSRLRQRLGLTRRVDLVRYARAAGLAEDRAP